LAENNKSRAGGKATKKRRSLPAVKLIELIEEVVDERAAAVAILAAPALSSDWQRQTNIWQKATSPTLGPKRQTSGCAK
jgi:hypothetical protein